MARHYTLMFNGVNKSCACVRFCEFKTMYGIMSIPLNASGAMYISIQLHVQSSKCYGDMNTKAAVFMAMTK